jgi:hypothetical protein
MSLLVSEEDHCWKSSGPWCRTQYAGSITDLIVEGSAKGTGALHYGHNMCTLPLVWRDNADLRWRYSPAHEVRNNLFHIGGLCVAQLSLINNILCPQTCSRHCLASDH